jgi:uncharacterized damage-inducible protein DinB
VLWKLDGLSEYDVRRPLVRTGTNLLGLVKHLAAVEYWWLCVRFGRATEPLPFLDEDPDADLRVESGESTADILAFYARANAATDAVVAELDVESTGTTAAGEKVTLRWALIHMIEETARHVGHMDIARELLDGATGDHRG